MNYRKIIMLVTVLCLVLALCACGKGTDPVSSGSDIVVPPLRASGSDLDGAAASSADLVTLPTAAPAPTADPTLPVNVMVLNGTTGFGMAKLIHDAAAGDAALEYAFSVESDASNVTAALVNGSCDIAALPTNAAAVVYNKTQGKVQCLALNTRGVLYLLAGAEENISTLADLEGRTVYAPAQNPSFIFQAICDAAGVNVTVDNSFAQPADLRTAVAAGQVALAVLPEPMVTIACAANDKLVRALDLTAEWNQVFPVGSLVQGCVVVRTEFAQAHPAEVLAFLEEYDRSIAYLFEGDDAAELIVEAGIFAQAPVAKKAIPNCNICYLTGEAMKSAMSDFLDVMAKAAPASIGGSVPGDDFYCILK